MALKPLRFLDKCDVIKMQKYSQWFSQTKNYGQTSKWFKNHLLEFENIVTNVHILNISFIDFELKLNYNKLNCPNPNSTNKTCILIVIVR